MTWWSELSWLQQVLLVIVIFILCMVVKYLWSARKARPQPAAPTPTPAGTSGTTSTLHKNWFEQNWKWMLGAIGAVILIALLWMGLPALSSLDPTQWILTPKSAMWFAIALAIAWVIEKKTHHWAATAAKWIIAIAFAAAVAATLYAKFGGSSTKQSACLPYSSSEARTCVITAEGVNLSTVEKTHSGEFEFCYLTPEHASLLVKQVGVNTFHFQSNGTDAFPMQYKMIRREKLINGVCPTTF